MDLSALGNSLGRVYISVKGNVMEGQQFVMLALGTDGPTFKGATFGRKDNDTINLYEYVTETGSKSSKALITTSKQQGSNEIPRRGGLFSIFDTQSYVYIMITATNTAYDGNFGQVISGMDVVDKAASSKYAITDITISECGIVLNY